MELDRTSASGYGDREHGFAPEFRRGKRGDGPLMRQFGHTRALRSPFFTAAVGFAGDGGLGGEASDAPGSFLRRPGWSKLERVGWNADSDRRRRRALRATRFELRGGLNATSRFVRSGSRLIGAEPLMALPCAMVEETPLRRSGMFQAGFPIRPQRPVRSARGFAPDGVLAAGIDRTAQSFPPCASFAKRRDFPVSRSFAGIRADEDRAPCRKFL